MTRKRQICTIHGFIYDLARDVQLTQGCKITKKANKQLETIMDLADEAHGYGQDMEDRLREYRTAVENLGFKRSK